MQQIEIAVDSHTGHELFVGTVLDDSSLIQDVDAVRESNSGEPMGDDHHRAPGRMFADGVEQRCGDDAAMFEAIAGSLLLNYYFTPPVHQFTIAEANNWLALGVFVAVGLAVS